MIAIVTPLAACDSSNPADDDLPTSIANGLAAAYPLVESDEPIGELRSAEQDTTRPKTQHRWDAL